MLVLFLVNSGADRKKGLLQHTKQCPWLIQQSRLYCLYCCSKQNHKWTIHVLAHNFPPVAQTYLVQALQDLLLLVPDSYFLIQDAHNIFHHALWQICGPKYFPNIVH